jgi:hypothetical protein
VVAQRSSLKRQLRDRERELGHEGCSAAAGAVDGQRSAERLNAVAQPDQPAPAGTSAADSVVADADLERATRGASGDLGALGLGVLGRVRVIDAKQVT